MLPCCGPRWRTRCAHRPMWSRPASDEHSEGTDVPTTDHIMSNHPDTPIDPPRVSGDDVPPAPRPKTPRQRASKVKVMAEPDVPHDDDVPSSTAAAATRARVQMHEKIPEGRSQSLFCIVKRRHLCFLSTHRPRQRAHDGMSFH